MYILSLECLYRQISFTLHLETESKAAHKMDIFCGKHGNTMSDLDSSYVSTTTTTNVTYKHTHSRYRTVARKEKCKAEREGRSAFVHYTHYYQDSSQFGKSNEAHTP